MPRIPLDGKRSLTIGESSTLDDYQAVVDIVADYIDLRRTTSKAYRHGNDPWPVVDRERERQGRARYRTGKITMAGHAREKGRAYILWYLVHETVHFHTSTRGHCTTFKKIETRALRDLFGIGIEYTKAYAEKLYDIETGKVYYDRTKEAKDKLGDSKQFEIGERVKLDRYPEYGNVTIKRRNKKTVTVEIQDSGRRYRHKAYPKNVTSLEE